MTIRKQYPKLAAKTTFFYVGYYATNIAFFPSNKLFANAATFGTHIWLIPTSCKTVLPSSGDVRVNVGITAKAVLEQPEKTLGRYTSAVADFPTHEEVVQYWSEVTGKPAAFMHVSGDDYVKAFGPPAEEIYANLQAFEENPKWSFDNNPLTAKDLGIEKLLVGTKATMESLKDQLL